MSGSLGPLARIGLMAVGYYVGGPIGATIGGMAGSLLFPEKLPGASGPRLGDQQFTTGTEGTAIPLVYGAHVVPGNFIWAAPLDEVKNTEEQGGKGGPSQEVTTYTYFLSFAVGLCEGVITGVPRIWENGKLIYDRRAQQPGESASDFAKRLAASDELDEQITIYFGDEEQLPDPVIESHEGVGEVSAHRGLAYIVFERRDVTEFGGRPAQYQFEITRAELVYTPTSELLQEVVHPWLFGNNIDPRNPLNDHEYHYGGQVASGGGPSPIRSSGAISGPAYVSPLASAQDALDIGIAEWEFGLPSIPVLPLQLVGHRPGNLLGESQGRQSSQFAPFYSVDAHEKLKVTMHFSEVAPVKHEYFDASNSGSAQLAFLTAEGALGPANAVKEYGSASASSRPAGSWWYGATMAGLAENPSYPQFKATRPLATTADNFLNTVTSASDWMVELIRVAVAPSIPGIEYPDWDADPEDYTQDPDTGNIYSKEPYERITGNFVALSKHALKTGDVDILPPLGPILEQSDPSNTEAYWTAQYDAAVLAGTQAEGKTYQANGLGNPNSTYPCYQDFAYYREYTQITYASDAGVTVGSIVRDQCERSGLVADTDFDVSELTEVIHGYKVERVMNGRDIIAPLRQYALFDGLETDKLRFPLRGGDIVATLTDDDLGAHEPGSSPPALVEAQRIEDVELPYAVRVRYADIDSEYQPGAQLSTIKVTAGKSAVDVETTIAMDATDAAQMSEIMLQESVMRREDYTVRIGPHWLALTATDPILIPLRGEYQRAMISEDTRALPGIIEAKATRDDQSIYVSNATGTPGGAGEQTLTQIGDTDLVIIDGPALGSGSNDGGVFIAACGASDRWRGFGLFESTDGGSNYSRIASYTLPSTMGTILDAIPEGPFDLWDYANSFTVAMDQGTLESRTQDEVVNGANAIFVGADGRWEVIQFAEAVAEGIDSGGRVIYRLSTLLRGRQGTEWAIGSSQVGDRLALCITTNRLTMEVARIGIPRLFKAVSFGRTTESGLTQTFTPRGVALKPYAPTSPEGQYNDDGDFTLTWVRRTRISAEWNDYDLTPLNEETEAYSVDLMDGDDVVSTTQTSVPSITFDAQELAQLSFGSSLGSIAQPLQAVIALDGYTYGIRAGDVMSVRGHSFDGASYSFVAGQSIGAPAADYMTGFETLDGALFVTVGYTLPGEDDGLYRFVPASGVPGSATHYAGTGTSAARGICVLNGSVWMTHDDTSNQEIIEFDPDDLSELSTINLTSIGAVSLMGIATDGTDLYVAARGTPGKLVRVTAAGSIVWQESVDNFSTDIAIAGGKAWVLSQDYLRVYSCETGSLLESFATRPSSVTDGLVECATVSTYRLRARGTLLYARSVSGGELGYTVFDATSMEIVNSDQGNGFVAGFDDRAVFLTDDDASSADQTDSGASTVALSLRPAGSVRIHQVSTAVGRGYPCEAIL